MLLHDGSTAVAWQANIEVLKASATDDDPFDPQLQTIIELLTPRLTGLESAPDPIAFVSYQVRRNR